MDVDEFFKWALGVATSLLAVLYWKNERELTRLAKNAHDDRSLYTPLGIFNLHAKSMDERHELAKEGRREIIDRLDSMAEKLDMLLLGRKP